MRDICTSCFIELVSPSELSRMMMENDDKEGERREGRRKVSHTVVFTYASTTPTLTHLYQTDPSAP